MNEREDFHFRFATLNQQRASESKGWLEFLNRGAVRCGIYHLPAGSVDRQQPHAEDEVYYVVEGKSHFEVEGHAIEVGPGSNIYVDAGDEHRFMDIEEDLSVLVFFSKNKPDSD